MQNTSYQNLIIGFGKAGKTLAGFLAKKGETVALVERSKERYGGTCINVACSKGRALSCGDCRETPPHSDAARKKLRQGDGDGCCRH